MATAWMAMVGAVLGVLGVLGVLVVDRRPLVATRSEVRILWGAL